MSQQNPVESSTNEKEENVEKKEKEDIKQIPVPPVIKPSLSSKEHQLLDLIDEVKQKLSDDEYKKLVEKLSEVNSENSNLYEIGFFYSKWEEHEEDDIQHHITWPCRRIVKVFQSIDSEEYKICKNDKISVPHYINRDKPFRLCSRSIIISGIEDEYNDCGGIGVFSMKRM